MQLAQGGAPLAMTIYVDQVANNTFRRPTKR
jgi:hypothetical protein